MKTKTTSIVFVGTSSGKTSIKRFHSSLLIKSPAFNLLVDCGDGTSKALLSQKIPLDIIDGILFSHLHPDHSAGLASLIVQMKQMKRVKELKIFCHKNLTGSLKMFLRHSFVFTERATFKLEYREFEHEEEIRVSENIIIKSRQNSHLDKYLKYLDDKSVCSCSSFLFNIDSKRIFYTGDISSKDDLYLFEDDYPEIVITESTHVELDDILEYCKMKKPKRIYLIHFSDELQVQLKKKIGSIPQSVRSKVILTNDAMNIKI